MASAAIALPVDIETASVEDLLLLVGEIEAQIEQRIDAIVEERRKRREHIQAILRKAGLSPDKVAKKGAGK